MKTHTRRARALTHTHTTQRAHPYAAGGGNNLYGDELVAALKTHDPSAAAGEPGDLSAYILMQRIFPPVNTTLCLRAGEMVELETLSELGIYGGYLRVGEETVMNTAKGGHLLRTKASFMFRAFLFFVVAVAVNLR